MRDGGMSETTLSPAERYIRGEDVLGEWLPNEFLFMEGDPAWSMPYVEAYLDCNVPFDEHELCDDQILGSKFVFASPHPWWSDDTVRRAEHIYALVLRLPHEIDSHGNPCCPVVDTLDLNQLHFFWELGKKRAEPA